jgi:hypothetical protein
MPPAAEREAEGKRREAEGKERGTEEARVAAVAGQGQQR